MAAAELFVQDALEYLNQQEVDNIWNKTESIQAGPASGFVMEEEMLSSHGPRRTTAVSVFSENFLNKLFRGMLPLH